MNPMQSPNTGPGKNLCFPKNKEIFDLTPNGHQCQKCLECKDLSKNYCIIDETINDRIEELMEI